MVDVTQEDREAAADYHANGGWGDGREHWLASVVDSHPLIQAFARHRIAAIDAARGKAEPVAWMYHHPSHPKRRPPASVGFIRVEGPLGDGWIETPLYAHPPADRVARVVEFIREQQANAHRHMLEAAHRKTASLFAAAFVTLRNLVDAIERGEPFNG